MILNVWTAWQWQLISELPLSKLLAETKNHCVAALWKGSFFYWRRWWRRWGRRRGVSSSWVSKPAVESSLSVFVAGWRTRENRLLRFPLLLLLLREGGGILHATAPPSGWSLRWVWRWRTGPSSLFLLFGDAEEKDTLQVHSVYLLKNYSKLKYLLLIELFTVAVYWFRKAFHFIF